MAAGVLVVLVAPDERTLGGAIKLVYVHVALTWTGLLGFAVAGLLGAYELLARRPWAVRWTTSVGDVALAFFGLSVLSSLLAARLTWGGVFWSEPRLQAALSVLAVGVILRVLAGWVSIPHAAAAAHLGLAGFAAWFLPRTPLVLHPGQAALTTPSSAIAVTFLSLSVLGVLLGGWLAWFVARSRGQAANERRT
jgi:hypothetical protein